MLITLNKINYDTAKNVEYKALLQEVSKLQKNKNTRALRLLENQIEKVLLLSEGDFNLYKKASGLPEIKPLPFATHYVAYSAEELLERKYTFVDGKFYILPKAGKADDYVYALIDKLLYESMRHDFQHEPCKSLRAAIIKFLPKSKNYSAEDYGKILFERETAAKTYYGECLSEDSDSEEEKSFSKVPKKAQIAKNKEAKIYCDAVQSPKFFKAFKIIQLLWIPIANQGRTFNAQQILMPIKRTRI